MSRPVLIFSLFFKPKPLPFLFSDQNSAPWFRGERDPWQHDRFDPFREQLFLFSRSRPRCAGLNLGLHPNPLFFLRGPIYFLRRCEQRLFFPKEEGSAGVWQTGRGPLRLTFSRLEYDLFAHRAWNSRSNRRGGELQALRNRCDDAIEAGPQLIQHNAERGCLQLE